MLEKEFHLRCRALIIDKEKILVCKHKVLDYCFLPGGHYEIGEKLEQTVLRELEEETGLKGKIKKYLGYFENDWIDRKTHHFEIVHLFKTELKNLPKNKNINSLEPHLEFLWLSIKELNINNFLPKNMISKIEKQLN